jgi:hypothetical protein
MPVTHSTYELKARKRTIRDTPALTAGLMQRSTRGEKIRHPHPGKLRLGSCYARLYSS